MERGPNIPSADVAKTFEDIYKPRRDYDCPVPRRPKFGEVGIEGSQGIKYNTYHGGDAQIGALGDKLVLMQVAAYWFRAMPASEVAQEYNKKTADFQEECMVFVPQE